MKLHELIRLHEEVHTIPGNVTTPNGMKSGGKYLAGTVDVAGGVYLVNIELERLPVQFGTVGGIFDCCWNQLTSLEGAPRTVGGSFSCNNNRLTTLEGAPGTVGGDFFCYNNQLTSLEGVHRILRRIGGMLSIRDNPIASGGIGLILVEGLTKIVADQPAFEIIEKYLGQGNKGVLRCQEALHDAGFEEFARL